MQWTHSRPRILKLLLLVLVALLYIISGKLGLHFALIHPSASAVWIPSGLAVSALIIFGYSLWPAVFVGAFVVNILTYGSLFTSLGIATGNTLEAIVATWLAYRFASGWKSFQRPGDVLKFAGFAALLSPILSSWIGVLSLAWGGYADWSLIGPIWLTWYLGDLNGIILIAPLLLCWRNWPRLHWTRWQYVEVVGLLSSAVVFGVFVFREPFVNAPQNYPLAFLCLIAPVWAALRFGPREAAMIFVITAMIAIWGTLDHFGPFALRSPHLSLLLLQDFLAVSTLLTLVLAAAAYERRQTQRALIEKNEILENIMSRRSEFLSMVTHELKTPLTPILEGVGIILDEIDGPLTAEQKKTLLIVQKNMKRLTRMLSTVLDYQKMEAQLGAVMLEWHDMKNLIEEVALTCHTETQKKHIRLRVDLPVGGVLLRCDADWMKQLLLELIENALKFTEAGGEVTIRLRATPQEVRLEIADTGIGIVPQDRDRIFTLFEQSHPSALDRQQGFGVGLAVCKKIVEAHHGTIRIDSNPVGQGTVFIIVLPRPPFGQEIPTA